MSLDGSAKAPRDPRGPWLELGCLEQKGRLRPGGGPWVNGIHRARALPAKLQRLPNNFNPMPKLNTTAKVVARDRRFNSAIRRLGRSFIDGHSMRGAKGKKVPILIGGAGGPVADFPRPVMRKTRHPDEV